MATIAIPRSPEGLLVAGDEVDEFDIDVRVTGISTFLTTLAPRAGYDEGGEGGEGDPGDPGEGDPGGGDWPTPPDNPEPWPTQGEITCDAGCDISGAPECHPDPGTNDCCEGGASIIPISDGAFTCDCPETTYCPQ